MSTSRRLRTALRKAVLKPISMYLMLATLLAGVVGALYLGLHAQAQVRTIDVPRGDLPAYHLITADDLVQARIRPSLFATGNGRTVSELTGRFSLSPLPAGQAVDEGQVTPAFDQTRLSGTAEFGISVTPATSVFTGVRAGDVVDVLFPRNAEAPVVFEDLPVLYIRQSNDVPSQLVVAVPVSAQQQFAAYIATGPVVVTRSHAS